MRTEPDRALLNKITPKGWPQIPALIVLLVVASILPEVVLLGADYGLWGTTRWRSLTYEHGAFWVGLLHGWFPNYPQQPHVMFLSYAFLHAGVWHMAVNMCTLIIIGKLGVERVGSWRFGLLYLASIFGGACGFALLTNRFQPMVGASGALFGLAAAWVIWDVTDTLRKRPGLTTLAYAIAWPIVFLTILNLAIYLSAGGNIAWETHLGGTIVGALLAPILNKKPTPPE